MSAKTARKRLRQHAEDIRIIDNGRSTATAEAADALGVEPARTAKSLGVRLGDRVVLVIARGDAHLDNAKCKAAFGASVRPCLSKAFLGGAIRAPRPRRRGDRFRVGRARNQLVTSRRTIGLCDAELASGLL